jgi:CDP-diglyceride synthetase
MPKAMPGLKKSVFRLVGMVVNLVALVVMIIGLFVIFQDEDFLLQANIIVLVFVGLMILFLKWMNDFVDDHRKIFLLVILIVAGVFYPVFMENIDNGLWFLGLPYIGVVLHTLYWHFSLSIYKKEKLMFIIFYAVVAILYIWPLVELDIKDSIVWPIVVVIIMTVGLLMVLLTEQSMKKAKLLNYI